MSDNDEARRANHLSCLRRRRDYLKGLLDQKKGNSWDVSEWRALTWAIDLLEVHLSTASTANKGATP